MPYPHEHAARIRNPGLFKEDSFRRKVVDRGVNIIIGKLKDGDDSMVIQAYRFDVSYFTAAQAKKWLRDHDIEPISFEAATKDSNFEPIKRTNGTESEFRVISDMCSYEQRFIEDNSTDYIVGRGVVYNTEVEIIPGVFEIIRPGSFSQSLNRFNELKCFINHDSAKILSTTRSNPALEITDNEESLDFRSPIPPTTYGNDLAINVKRGNISGASFSFMINDGGEKFTMDEDGNYHREITSAEIYEVGPVTNPAYQQTSVALRNKELIKSKLTIVPKKEDYTLREITDFLSKRKGL